MDRSLNKNLKDESIHEKSRKINEKAEDFIGWVSEDGALEVIEMLPRIPYKEARYKVTCTECSKDKELFPDGYFISTKSHLKEGKKPCGCAKNTHWKEQQYIVLAERSSKGKNFTVLGFIEPFKNQNSKLECECNIEGHKWYPSVASVVNKVSYGCPVCKIETIKEKRKIPEIVATERCEAICKIAGYKPIGFITGYINNTSKFEYECPTHGKHIVRYNDFVINSRRCPDCGFDKLSEDRRLPNDIVLKNCKSICKEMNYEFLGFPDGYKNRNSYFRYRCSKHDIKMVQYGCFVNNGTRCPDCWKERQIELGNGNGFYPERAHEQDFLYILNFNNEFIKVGRSFDIERRIGELQNASGVNNILKIQVYTATHKEIYDYEQEVLSKLRIGGFQRQCEWTKESFINECSNLLWTILDHCSFKKLL